MFRHQWLHCKIGTRRHDSGLDLAVYRRERGGSAARRSAHMDGRRILVVEDDQAIRDLVVILLRKSGFHPIGVADGYRALAACETDNIDLAILDVRMPGLSGWEVMDQLEERGMLGRFPIIILSATLAMAEEAKRFEGVCMTLPKPFSIAELVEAVNGCLPTAA